MKIEDLKRKDRPRERLIALGPRALSDVELLAVLLGSGTKDCCVLDMASRILKKYSPKELKELSYNQMIQLYGIKTAKACQLLACFELARRGGQAQNSKASLETATDIYSYVYDEIFLEFNEVILCILVDCKLKPIKKLVERGDSPHQVAIPIKKFIKEALACQAYGIILVHNHPSGDVEASEADIFSTKEFQSILATLDILLLDHLVVSASSYYSMHEHGILQMCEEYSLLGDPFEKSNY